MDFLLEVKNSQSWDRKLVNLNHFTIFILRRIKALLALWSELLCLLYDESKNQKGILKIPGRHNLPEEKPEKKY